MKNTVQDKVIIEKKALYSKDKKHRYELTLILLEKKGKSILILGSLQLYSMKPEFDDDNFYTIPTRGKKKIV